MEALVRGALKNPYAITMAALAIMVVSGVALLQIPIDILPVFQSPAVLTMTFYQGMPANQVEREITNRLERWTGQAAGIDHQESKSMIGVSIVKNYFHDSVDAGSAVSQILSLAMSDLQYLPPGTLPPVVIPFDPTATTPISILAVSSKHRSEANLYDIARFDLRNQIGNIPGAYGPAAYGGKTRAIMAYVDRVRLQARGMDISDVVKAINNYNLMLPVGDAKFGGLDYALDSNAMVDRVGALNEIPLKVTNSRPVYMRDVGEVQDAARIQTNIVRIDGQRRVYIPIYRQQGASTVAVVDAVKAAVPQMPSRLPAVEQKDLQPSLVMDQSVPVREAIRSLIHEGVIGAALASIMILLFLGDFRMTAIATMSIPLSVAVAVIGLYFKGDTINVMTLAGLALAIGPLVDDSIVVLENTHRHLGMGKRPLDAAGDAAIEVTLPVLVATLTTMIVFLPIALIPGFGKFLFRPLVWAFGLAMYASFLLSRTFVPSKCAIWMKPHVHHEPGQHRLGPFRRFLGGFDALLKKLERAYTGWLQAVLNHKLIFLAVMLALFALSLLFLPRIGKELFPEVDSGQFVMTVRCPTGTRIERTEAKVKQIEAELHRMIPEQDLEMVIAEIGVVPDFSAAYTLNSGPQDTVIRVQLKDARRYSSQDYVRRIRPDLERKFPGLLFSYDTGGLIMAALNQGLPAPIDIRVQGPDLRVSAELAKQIQAKIRGVRGAADLRIEQRLDYPMYRINVDRKRAADLGLTSTEIVHNVVASLNSSIQYNHNFWIDSRNGNQYFVGAQYPEERIVSLETLENITITSPTQPVPVLLRNVAKIERASTPSEINHANILPMIDLDTNVAGRDIGGVANDIEAILNRWGTRTKSSEGRTIWHPRELPGLGGDEPEDNGTLLPAPPRRPGPRIIQAALARKHAAAAAPRPPRKPAAGTNPKGYTVEIMGVYAQMEAAFGSLGWGILFAALLVYMLMVSLFKSYIGPLIIMCSVPMGLIGVLIMLFLTHTTLNVQSLVGVVFMIGILVSNSVLVVDFTNVQRQQGMSVHDAVVSATAIRLRPVLMTFFATFLDLLPMAIGMGKGSEANIPLARAVIGGLLMSPALTLFMVPILYELWIKDAPRPVVAAVPNVGGGVHGSEAERGDSATPAAGAEEEPG